MKSIDRPIAGAATDAVREATDQAHKRGLADIAASGLGERWVKSFKQRFYINDGIDAAGIVYSGINFGVVFERGATIHGSPTLWIPLPTTPKKLGRKPLTAKRFSHEVARLFKIRIGGKDYLAAKVNVTKGQAGRVVTRSVAMLKRKAGKSTRTALVPMFVAANSTHIRKRLHIGQIAEQAADRLPQLYADALKDD